jgi:hypothetical protein
MSILQEKGHDEKENEPYFNFINSLKSDVTWLIDLLDNR